MKVTIKIHGTQLLRALLLHRLTGNFAILWTQCVGLSVRESHTFAQMKSVVDNLEVQVTEINSLFKSQPNESFFRNKISDLQDKITQFDNSFKVNFQALTARIAETELENDNIKSENNKMKSEVKPLKRKLKSIEHSSNEKLTQPGV